MENQEVKVTEEVTIKVTEETSQDNARKFNTQQIISAIIVIGFFIVGAILLKGSTPPNIAEGSPADNSNQLAKLPVRPVDASEHILGNPEAEVFIVEYSDTECPYCKVFHGTVHNIISDESEKVAWVYRHYPIPQLHPKATHEAVATECAWEQGGNEAFWQYTDQVYIRTNSNNSLEVSELPKIAGDLGLNVAQFNACLSSEKYADKVQADIDNGEKLGIRGTPTSFIVKNGKVVDIIEGAQPEEVVSQKIQQALK